MIKSSTLAFSIAIAALNPATVSAQTREVFGPVLPMIYDGQGGRHYCLNGYDGPFDPPMASHGNGDTLVCRSEHALRPKLQREQAGARAHAEARK